MKHQTPFLILFFGLILGSVAIRIYMDHRVTVATTPPAPQRMGSVVFGEGFSSR